MIRKDYTPSISHYIPNEKKYYFVFPLDILAKYHGISNLDVTLDDELLHYLFSPILNNNIEYHYELIWKNKIVDSPDHSLIICVRLNNEKFDPKIVLDNLEKHQMIAGLELFRDDHYHLTKIY